MACMHILGLTMKNLVWFKYWSWLKGTHTRIKGPLWPVWVFLGLAIKKPHLVFKKIQCLPQICRIYTYSQFLGRFKRKASILIIPTRNCRRSIIVQYKRNAGFTLTLFVAKLKVANILLNEHRVLVEKKFAKLSHAHLPVRRPGQFTRNKPLTV